MKLCSEYDSRYGERVWYGTGFDSENPERFGGIEKIAQVLPGCFERIKERAGKTHTEGVARYFLTTAQGDESEGEIGDLIRKENLTEMCMDFTSAFMTDMWDAYHSDEKWRAHGGIKPVCDAYEKYQNKTRELDDKGWCGIFLDCPWTLIPIALGGSGASMAIHVAGSYAAAHGASPEGIAGWGFIGGLAGFVIGVATIPLLVSLPRAINNLRPSVRKRERKLREEAMNEYINSIDEYVKKFK